MSDQASIPDTCTVEGHLLASNGTGMRRLFLVNVYKAVLFSAEPVRQPSDLFEASKPLRIHFEYLYGPISRDRIAAAWEGALFKAIGEAHADAIKSFIDTIT